MSYKIWVPTLRFLETLLHLPKMVMTNTLLLKMTIKIVDLPIENGGSVHSFCMFLLKPPGCCPVLGFTFQPMWARLKNRNPLPLMDSFIFAWAKNSDFSENRRVLSGLPKQRVHPRFRG